MAITAATGMIASAAISAAGSAGSAIAAGKLNKKNRKWQDKNWERQQQQNQENWNQQNKYNEDMYNKYQSPEAQMRQLKEAGVNPYLHFAQGNNQMSAVQASSMPDSGQGGSPNTIDPTGHISDTGKAVQNAFQNALQYSLQKRAADSALLNDQTNRGATTANTVSTLQGLQEQKIDILQKIEQLSQNRQLNPIVRKKMEAEYNIMLDENQRAWKRLENDGKVIQQGERRLSQQDRQLQLQAMSVAIDSRRADNEGRRIDNEINRLTMDQQRNYTLNQLTRAQTGQVREQTTNLIQQYYHEIEKMKLTKTQVDHLTQSINLMEAQELKTYIDAGGSAVDLISQFMPGGKAVPKYQPKPRQK